MKAKEFLFLIFFFIEKVFSIQMKKVRFEIFFYIYLGLLQKIQAIFLFSTSSQKMKFLTFDIFYITNKIQRRYHSWQQEQKINQTLFSSFWFLLISFHQLILIHKLLVFLIFNKIFSLWKETRGFYQGIIRQRGSKTCLKSNLFTIKNIFLSSQIVLKKNKRPHFLKLN